MTDWYIEQTIEPIGRFGKLVANRTEDEWEDYTDVVCALLDVEELLKRNKNWTRIENPDLGRYTLLYTYYDSVLDDKLIITYSVKKKKNE